MRAGFELFEMEGRARKVSRSGYSDDIDDWWALIRWRGAVNAAIKGKRGQLLLKEMAAALDAMPVKRLVAESLMTNTGEVCALGAVAKARGMDVSGVDPEDRELVARKFGIAEALVAEIVYENDNDFGYCNEEPEKRWKRVREWVNENVVKPVEREAGDDKN